MRPKRACLGVPVGAVGVEAALADGDDAGAGREFAELIFEASSGVLRVHADYASSDAFDGADGARGGEIDRDRDDLDIRCGVSKRLKRRCLCPLLLLAVYRPADGGR